MERRKGQDLAKRDDIIRQISDLVHDHMERGRINSQVALAEEVAEYTPQKKCDPSTISRMFSGYRLTMMKSVLPVIIRRKGSFASRDEVNKIVQLLKIVMDNGQHEHFRKLQNAVDEACNEMNLPDSKLEKKEPQLTKEDQDRAAKAAKAAYDAILTELQKGHPV